MPAPPNDRTLVVRLADRPGAVERLLGLLRRKAMDLTPRSIERGEAGDGWTVLIELPVSDATLRPYVNEIRQLVDVRRVTVLEEREAPSDHPDSAPARP